MATVVETFIICDDCGENHGVDSRNSSAKEQRDSAKENGWLRVTEKQLDKWGIVLDSGLKTKDICPECKVAYLNMKKRSKKQITP